MQKLENILWGVLGLEVVALTMMSGIVLAINIYF